MLRKEDALRGVVAGLVSVIVLASLVVAARAGWDAVEVSRVVMSGLAALLLVIGVIPRGPGSGAASAALVVASGELSSSLVSLFEGVQ